MKIIDILEAIAPVGSTTSPMPAPTSAPLGKPAPGAISGNTTAMADPKLQAAQLVQQKQEKEKQKQAVQAQIKAKQEELQMLQQQQQELNKTV